MKTNRTTRRMRTTSGETILVRELPPMTLANGIQSLLGPTHEVSRDNGKSWTMTTIRVRSK